MIYGCLGRWERGRNARSGRLQRERAYRIRSRVESRGRHAQARRLGKKFEPKPKNAVRREQTPPTGSGGRDRVRTCDFCHVRFASTKSFTPFKLGYSFIKWLFGSRRFSSSFTRKFPSFPSFTSFYQDFGFIKARPGEVDFKWFRRTISPVGLPATPMVNSLRRNQQKEYA